MLNAFKHLQKILVHKANVARYCFMCGLYFQGITHDLSKFSPTEFVESVRYYQGTESPITACKRVNGYSLAWFHHKGRNKHHWEYWVDDFDKGMIPKKIPFKYVLEMVCDYLGAGRAYAGKKFTIESEIAWWKEHREKIVVHENVRWALDTLFGRMEKHGIEKTLKNRKFIRHLKHEYSMR